MNQNVKFYQIFVGDILQDPEKPRLGFDNILSLTLQWSRTDLPALLLGSHEQMQADEESNQVSKQGEEHGQMEQQKLFSSSGVNEAYCGSDVWVEIRGNRNCVLRAVNIIMNDECIVNEITWRMDRRMVIRRGIPKPSPQ